jgi:CheY-like chemotaxis protein
MVGEAAFRQEGIVAEETLRPDLVLMDVRRPGTGGWRAARILVDRHP